MQNKKGSVLMISLWILAILVVFALGLGHRAAINLRLARYQRDRLKATCLAKAGINRAIAELIKDKNDTSRQYDSLDEPWSTGTDNNKNIFEDIEIVEKSGETFTVKVTDEERRININTASRELLITLLTDKAGTEVGQNAETIADLVRIWRGENTEGFTTDIDTANFKKSAFSVPEELFTILDYFYQNRGEQAQNMYKEIKDLITVYPISTNIDATININTVKLEIFKIFASSIGNETQKLCSPRIAERIIQLREDKENKAFENVADIKPELDNDCNEDFLNDLKERIVLKSAYFRIASQGKVGNITKSITAIYDRDNDKIVYWHEN